MVDSSEPLPKIIPFDAWREQPSDLSDEWRKEMRQNDLITDYYDQRPMTPPPTEPRALAEWVGENAQATAKVILSDPEKHGVMDYPPKLAARLLYKFADDLVLWHRADLQKDRDGCLLRIGRVEQVEEILNEMGISDTTFIKYAFKRIPGFHYKRFRNP